MLISPLIHHLYAPFLKAWGWICQNDVKIFLEVVRLIMYNTVDKGFLFSLSSSFSILLCSLEAEKEEEEWEEG